MELQVGTKLHGFTVERVRKVEELSGTLYEMRHDKTGAELCWMDNGEMNKLFSVAFKTLPEDDTGVFHILEHSVLCGSEKYSVKEPFVDLMKSSMNTFLNAMTYPDKTVYPVSSRNEQDFLNLMSVYLDAVFAPNLLRNPNIFYQEGWHTEMDEEGNLSFKGVVFNEMKGATAGVDRALFAGVQTLLFPDNCYRFESGGDPAAIPNLTYEQYCDTYRRFYHPSNARIFLDGTVPLEKTLEEIDSYLSRYERNEEKHVIAHQEPKAAELTQYYEVAPGEGENKDVFTVAKLMCGYEDRKTAMAMDILCEYLTDTNESPLTKAILEKGLAEDVDMGTLDEMEQNGFMLNIRNTSMSKEADIRAAIRSTVEGLLEKGLDKSALTACLNRKAFRIKDQQEPAGLIRNLRALGSWLYGGDPVDGMVWNDIILQLRDMVDNGGFDALLRSMLLDEENLCVLRTLPSETLGQEKAAKEAARLDALKASWKEEDAAALREMNEKLLAWQSTPDSPEQTASMPVLSLDEIGEEMEFTDTEVSEAEGVTVLYHPVASNGIVHMNMYFSLTDKTLPELTNLSLLTGLFSNLPTKTHPDVAALQQEVKSLIGRLNFDLAAMAPKGESRQCRPCLTVNCSVLEENLSQAAALVREILTETDFSDKESIRTILLQNVEQLKQFSIMQGHRLAFMESTAHLSAVNAVTEATDGFTAVKAAQAMAKDFDNVIDGLVAEFNKVVKESVCRSRMTLSFTADKPVDAKEIAAAYPVGTAAAPLAAYKTEIPYKLGIAIPAQVGFSSQAASIERSGVVKVAAQMLSLDYLWNVVRVQGGAYGAGLNARGESMMTYSFRDPTPAKTIETYGGMAEVLEAYCDSDEVPDKYIISTAAEPLMSPSQKGAVGDSQYFTGISREDALNERREMLHTTKEQMRAWVPALKALAEGPLCVVGPQSALTLPGLEIREL